MDKINELQYFMSWLQICVRLNWNLKLFSQTWRDYLKNHCTNTRLVCTHSDAFFMLIQNTAMKIWISKFVGKKFEKKNGIVVCTWYPRGGLGLKKIFVCRNPADPRKPTWLDIFFSNQNIRKINYSSSDRHMNFMVLSIFVKNISKEAMCVLKNVKQNNLPPPKKNDQQPPFSPLLWQRNNFFLPGQFF